jgi:hypothetical protein
MTETVTETVTVTETEPPRRIAPPDRRLRLLFTVNGVANLAGGVLILPFAGSIEALLGLSHAAIVAIGLFYLGYGATMWFTATRAEPDRTSILSLIAVNPAWAIVCLLLLGAQPTTLGAVLLAAEAVTVTGLAGLELAASRIGGRTDRSAPAEPRPRRRANAARQS